MRRLHGTFRVCVHRHIRIENTCEGGCGLWVHVSTDISTIGPSPMHGPSCWKVSNECADLFLRFIWQQKSPSCLKHHIFYFIWAKCLETLCARESCYPLENPRMEQHCWVPSCCSEKINLDGIGTAAAVGGGFEFFGNIQSSKGLFKAGAGLRLLNFTKDIRTLTHLRGVSTFCSVLHAGACMRNHEKKGNYQPWVVTGSVFAWVLSPSLCCPSRRLPRWTLRSTGWDVHLGCVVIELCLLNSLASCVLLCGDKSPVTFQKENSDHTRLKGIKNSLIFCLPHPWSCVTPQVNSWLVGLG